MRRHSRERCRADGHDHEFLEIHVVVRVHAAVDDVHHRHRENLRLLAADITIKRQIGVDGRRAGNRQRNAEDGVRAKLGLVRVPSSAIEILSIARKSASWPMISLDRRIDIFNSL